MINFKHLLQNTPIVYPCYFNNNNFESFLRNFFHNNEQLHNNNVYVVFTYDESFDKSLIHNLIEVLPTVKIYEIDKNNGHDLGALILDDFAFELLKKSGRYVKMAQDVLVLEQHLDYEVEDADFIYINGFGFSTIKETNSIKDLMDNHFYPQTNFYVLKTDKLSELFGMSKLYNLYDTYKSMNTSKRMYEVIPNTSCEEMLSKVIKDNSLTKFDIMTESD